MNRKTGKLSAPTTRDSTSETLQKRCITSCSLCIHRECRQTFLLRVCSHHRPAFPTLVRLSSGPCTSISAPLALCIQSNRPAYSVPFLLSRRPRLHQVLRHPFLKQFVRIAQLRNSIECFDFNSIRRDISTIKNSVYPSSCASKPIPLAKTFASTSLPNSALPFKHRVCLHQKKIQHPFLSLVRLCRSANPALLRPSRYRSLHQACLHPFLSRVH